MRTKFQSPIRFVAPCSALATITSLAGREAGNFGNPPDTIAVLKDRVSKSSRILPLIE